MNVWPDGNAGFVTIFHDEQEIRSDDAKSISEASLDSIPQVVLEVRPFGTEASHLVIVNADGELHVVTLC